jgi:SAM-dependent methyltransferase
MALNLPPQYATDVNLRARQRLWEHQQPRFDITGWVLDVAGLDSAADRRVLDVGCGNGIYLAALRGRGVDTVGCDLSAGMLAAARPHPTLVNADVTRLPFPTGAFDVVLAPHMLYHVPDRPAAAQELRRVLSRGGRCLVVTNGRDHLRGLLTLIEAAVRVATPGWEMRNPSTHVFSLENGEQQLRRSFDHVSCLRPPVKAPVVLTDAAVAAGYVASLADHYQAETTRPWHEVAEDVGEAVQREIDQNGVFVDSGVTGILLCR